MFFKENNHIVHVSNIYTSNYTLSNSPFFLQIDSRVPHTMSLVVKENRAAMKVDELDASYSKFYFSTPPYGYFSLVSNNYNPYQGGYKYIRLTSNGKTLLELDFTKLSSVSELEAIFDSYHIDSLADNTPARPASISDYWALNDSGHLICRQAIRNTFHYADASNLCMLTLRSEPIGSFELTMEFTQSWYRYGVCFGCKPGEFPYTYNPNNHTYIPLEGAFAYVEAEGHRNMRGNLLQSAFNNVKTDIVRYSDQTLPTFCSHENKWLLSSNKPTINYHIDADGKYIFNDTALPLRPGCFTYLPANTRYLSSCTHDRHITVEFDLFSANCPAPDYTVPLHSNNIQSLFGELLLLKDNPSSENYYKTQAIFYQILAETKRNDTHNTNVPEIIQPSLSYILQNYCNPDLTIADIANASHISEVYFREIFKKATGQLPNKYILNLRINRSMFLLRNSNYTISEIAIKSGFSNIKYFMTTFKKLTGSSPRQYRQNMP